MKKIIITFILSIIISVILSPINGGYITIFTLTGFRLYILISSFVYAAFTYFILKTYGNKVPSGYLLLAVLAGCSLIESGRLYYPDTVISLLTFVGKLVAITGTYISYSLLKIYSRLAGFIITLTICVWMGIYGQDIWTQKLYHNSFSRRVSQTIQSDIIFDDSNGEKVNLSSTGKYLFLDFWFSSCGVCFSEFPQLQELVSKYKEYPDLDIYSIHSRLSKVPGVIEEDEDYKTGVTILKNRNIVIPCLSTSREDPLFQELNIQSFPTVLIIDPEGTIIFRGRLAQAKDYLEKIL